MPVDDYREGSAYLVVEPGRYNKELRIVRTTQKVPRTVAGDSVVVRINLRLPKTAFRPMPMDLLVVDENLIRQGEIEALDPSDDAAEDLTEDAATWTPDEGGTS